ncbi:MAG: hypothetical protein U5K79_02465 [Cyclobacteriaceae bacterium]|nr:hypothetical protein [Cyclobacteriaceae bacterium]
MMKLKGLNRGKCLCYVVQFLICIIGWKKPEVVLHADTKGQNESKNSSWRHEEDRPRAIKEREKQQGIMPREEEATETDSIDHESNTEGSIFYDWNKT